ncbi:MAG: ABC transporter permease subunit [Acidobacteriota bacterium]|nr:ABC transporter permease subunit [Acidobacteriota bacterium]
MASIGGGIAAELAIEEVEALPPGRRGWRRPRISVWRSVVFFLAGLYFLLPIYAGMKFALEDLHGKFSFSTIQSLPHTQGFADAFILSLKLAAATLVVEAILIIPTTIYVHLRLPRLRRMMDFVTILPIVIPPIIIILGVLSAAPLWLRASPYLLSLEYVILSLPFIYRSLDSGLTAIDLKTLVEASRSLGGNWVKTIWRVVLPNLRASLLSALVLSLALVLGEFTMASLDLWVTIPVWIVQTNSNTFNGHIQVAASMLGLIVTWVLLTVIVSLDRSESRRRKARLTL